MSVLAQLPGLERLAIARVPVVLDFDIENRPLSYWYDGNCTAEITAIAAAFDDEFPQVRVLTNRQGSGRAMLKWFRKLWDQADLVTGHYIRKHDLPIIQGALLELGLPPLDAKLTSDTKLDLIKRGSISTSQEALAAMYALPEPKHHMDQSAWREANRLTPAGVELTRTRVYRDVVQHRALRKRLLEADALKPPRVWRP
jgi:hypothetical protein